MGPGNPTRPSKLFANSTQFILKIKITSLWVKLKKKMHNHICLKIHIFLILFVILALICTRISNISYWTIFDANFIVFESLKSQWVNLGQSNCWKCWYVDKGHLIERMISKETKNLYEHTAPVPMWPQPGINPLQFEKNTTRPDPTRPGQTLCNPNRSTQNPTRPTLFWSASCWHLYFICPGRLWKTELGSFGRVWVEKKGLRRRRRRSSHCVATNHLLTPEGWKCLVGREGAGNGGSPVTCHLPTLLQY